ncbi:hypothetical protein ACFL6N_01045 [Thermodesulfobacteriota bacterium]
MNKTALISLLLTLALGFVSPATHASDGTVCLNYVGTCDEVYLMYSETANPKVLSVLGYEYGCNRPEAILNGSARLDGGIAYIQFSFPLTISTAPQYFLNNDSIQFNTGSGTGSVQRSSHENCLICKGVASQWDGTVEIVPCFRPKKVVFTTSQGYTGNMGGLAGADANCQTLADAAELEGTFKAWMSDDALNANDRLTHSTDPYVRTDGTQIAADWDDLIDGTLDVPLDYDENGTEIETPWPYVWTWTTSSGIGGTPGFNCNNWTSEDSFVKGEDGHLYETNYKWAIIRNNGCDEGLKLYCFQQ